jgi:DNA modification methylase
LNSWRIIEGDCRDVLASIPERSAHTCVTSPPYFGLRDYGHDGQIGLEPTPDEFVAALVDVFRGVRRVLRDDGTVWLNLGDSYAGSGPSGASYDSATTRRRAEGNGQDGAFRVSPTLRDRGLSYAEKKPIAPPGYKPKDLLGIPWMVAFALRADGWYLRSEIIWAKRNCMPESVTDRPTKAHEQLFLLSKRPSYFYDSGAIREEDVGADHPRQVLDGQPSLEPSGGLHTQHSGLRTPNGRDGAGRNKRSVWTVATQPYAGAHFATFPPKLIEPCVLAGCPEGGTVLDPFAGTGTTGMVALRHNRSFVGVELSPVYAAMARERIVADAPLLNSVAEAA